MPGQSISAVTANGAGCSGTPCFFPSSKRQPGATTLDAVDLDAIDVQASGHGTAPEPLWPKLVTPVLTAN